MVGRLLIFAAGVLLAMLLAEWLHARRVRRASHLAFGPVGAPRAWVSLVPVLRSVATAALVFGLSALWAIQPRVMRRNTMPEKDFRRILLVMDCSPSMYLTDAGPASSQMRSRRAGEAMMSVIDRADLERAKVSIVAFYTQAKPVVVDCVDPGVVRNVLNDLPLDQAFPLGKTDLFNGLREAFDLAKDWRAGSTTLFVITDGDTIPPSGMPKPPPAIAASIVLGVGNARVGKYIDGHQSRQDTSTLRQLATRLGGVYCDCNIQQLPTSAISELSEALPIRDDNALGLREAAIACVASGAATMALLPPALAAFGSVHGPSGRRATPRRRESVQDGATSHA